jgi:parallel beta-helix repeat protein
VLLRNFKFLILVILFLTFVSTSSSARIINVPADSSTIQSGINGASDGDTVLVARGHYYERINFYGKAILVASNYIFDNDTTTIDSTIIDADTLILGVADTGSVVVFVSSEDSTSIIQGFTLQNGIGTPYHGSLTIHGGGIYCEASTPTISYNIITLNINSGICCYKASPIIRNNNIIKNQCGAGGGICVLFSSLAIIRNNQIDQNSADFGGGIFCFYGANPTIINNIIKSNTAYYTCAGIYSTNSSPVIINNTIIRNSGDGISSFHESYPTIFNNIISNNREGEGIVCDGGAYPTVLYNNVFSNTEGNFVGCPPGVGDTTWGANINGIPCDSFYNIIRDPLFVDTLNDFRLQEGSPCIDAGDNYAAPGSDLDGNPRIVDGNEDDSAVVDMGAYEYQPSVSITEEIKTFSTSDFVVFQNYPNPFNPKTTIEYYLPKSSWVNLTIYNVLGQKIKVLVNDFQTKGKKTIAWDGKDLKGRKVATGIYFYRLVTSDYVESKKMLLIK